MSVIGQVSRVSRYAVHGDTICKSNRRGNQPHYCLLETVSGAVHSEFDQPLLSFHLSRETWEVSGDVIQWSKPSGEEEMDSEVYQSDE